MQTFSFNLGDFAKKRKKEMWHLAFEDYSYFSPHSTNSCKVLIDSSLPAPLSALALPRYS